MLPLEVHLILVHLVGKTEELIGGGDGIGFLSCSVIAVDVFDGSFHSRLVRIEPYGIVGSRHLVVVNDITLICTRQIDGVLGELSLIGRIIKLPVDVLRTHGHLLVEVVEGDADNGALAAHQFHVGSLGGIGIRQDSARVVRVVIGDGELYVHLTALSRHSEGMVIETAVTARGRGVAILIVCPCLDGGG